MAERKRPAIILGSGSAARRAMLEQAGVTFAVDPARIDERAVQDVLVSDEGDVEAADIAELLAEAKARDVSSRHPGAVVIGADQVLDHDGEILTKPGDLAEAKATLRLLRAASHTLHSGVAIARDGEILWSLVDSAELTMRKFSDAFLAAYVAAEGESLCSSVGAYMLEGRGMQLFERIEGDYHTILGMPLLPLLAELRTLGAIET